jgi:hypothetical protein
LVTATAREPDKPDFWQLHEGKGNKPAYYQRQRYKAETDLSFMHAGKPGQREYGYY